MKRKYSIIPFVALLCATFFSTRCTKRVEETTILRIEILSVGNDYPRQSQLHFSDARNGMLIVNRWQIYRTIDGATSDWTLAYQAVNSTREISTLNYVSPGCAVISVRNPSDQNRHTFYHSSNYGQTWNSGGWVGMVYGTSFYSPTEGYYSGTHATQTSANNLWYTSNSGVTWQLRAPAIHIPEMLQFLDYNRGFSFNRPILMATNDAGLTWQQLCADVYCMSEFLPDGTGYKVLNGNERDILKTTDFGATWTTVYSNNAEAYFNDIDCHPNGTVVAVGAGSILLSRDYGLTWRFASCTDVSFADSYLADVEILDTEHFVILGNSGSTDFIYRASIL